MFADTGHPSGMDPLPSSTSLLPRPGKGNTQTFLVPLKLGGAQSVLVCSHSKGCSFWIKSSPEKRKGMPACPQTSIALG